MIKSAVDLCNPPGFYHGQPVTRRLGGHTKLADFTAVGWVDCNELNQEHDHATLAQEHGFWTRRVIPRRHAGDGEDLSPPLEWSGLPADTRELALIVDDPDAPSAQPWVHWVIARIPAAESGIAEGVHPSRHPAFPPGPSRVRIPGEPSVIADRHRPGDTAFIIITSSSMRWTCL